MQRSTHNENTTHQAARDMAAGVEKAIESNAGVAEALESLRKTLEEGFDALSARVDQLTGKAGEQTGCSACGGKRHEG